MYPGSQDEPGPQGRDSPRGLLIAPGILMRLVPGSPAAAYLRLRSRFLKHSGQRLDAGGQRLELGKALFVGFVRRSG